MAYQEFVDGILEIIGKSGEECHAMFEHDEEKGLHIARVSNGLIFTGNSSSCKVTVRGINGFMAQCIIAA